MAQKKKKVQLIESKCESDGSNYDFDNITPKYFILPRPDGAESICLSDDRTKLLVTTVMPYKAICKLFMKTKSGKNFIGTGWLTHSNKLYTAGHCVYDHDEGGWMDSIIVIPAMSGSNEPYGRYVSTDLIAAEPWISNKSKRYDMGAIKLNSNVSHNDYIKPILADTDMATVCGYPADRDTGNYQYKMRDTLRKKDDRFFYFIDTFGGQSGGPILKDNANSVGIHNYGGCENSGSDLYSDFIDNINNW